MTLILRAFTSASSRCSAGRSVEPPENPPSSYRIRTSVQCTSVARSSVAAGKWFLQRLDGEKPDVFCHATQLMHGAEAARLTPLNAVDRMYVAARGFQPRGKPNHQQRYCVEHIARGTPQLSPSRRMARRAEPWCVSDTSESPLVMSSPEMILNGPLWNKPGLGERETPGVRFTCSQSSPDKRRF